jgi:hypothetical protein
LMHDLTDYILNSSCLTRRLALGVPNGIEKFPRLIQQKSYVSIRLVI